jgi:hypothetical protein
MKLSSCFSKYAGSTWYRSDRLLQHLRVSRHLRRTPTVNSVGGPGAHQQSPTRGRRAHRSGCCCQDCSACTHLALLASRPASADASHAQRGSAASSRRLCWPLVHLDILSLGRTVQHAPRCQRRGHRHRPRSLDDNASSGRRWLGGFGQWTDLGVRWSDESLLLVKITLEVISLRFGVRTNPDRDRAWTRVCEKEDNPSLLSEVDEGHRRFVVPELSPPRPSDNPVI